jgi:hypothetical protein
MNRVVLPEVNYLKFVTQATQGYDISLPRRPRPKNGGVSKISAIGGLNSGLGLQHCSRTVRIDGETMSTPYCARFGRGKGSTGSVGAWTSTATVKILTTSVNL